MNHDDDDIGALLRSQADARLGSLSTPRPFVPTDEARPVRERRARTRGPWVLPLIAAACVATVVGGTVGVRHLVADRHQAPATHAPTVEHTPTPTPSTSATPSTTPGTPTPSRTKAFVPAGPGSASHGTTHSHASSATVSTSPASSGPQFTTRRLGGGAFAVPDGWDVHIEKAFESGSLTYQRWCLGPAGNPCTVHLVRIPSVKGTIPDLDVDVPGAGLGDAGFANCDITSELTGPRAFGARLPGSYGGRMAEWRQWDYSCGASAPGRFVQYTVAADPGFVLTADTSDSPLAADPLSAIASEIVTRSTLPTIDATSRFMDRGVVRSVEHQDSQVIVFLSRSVSEPRNGQPHYVVSSGYPDDFYVSADFFAAHPVSVGDQILIRTDGKNVTVLQKE